MNRLSLGILVGCITAVGCGTIAVRGTLTASGNLVATVDAWSRFSSATGGLALTSSGAEDVPALMQQINRDGVRPGEPVDLVYVVDTTGSMGDDIQEAREQMRAILTDLSTRNPDRRVGIVAYRDREDDYVSQTFLSLDADDDRIQAGITALEVDGGGDLREHVYAGLDEALRNQAWRAGAAHHIVLIGDAPPHDDYRDDPRTFDSVMTLAQSPGAQVHIHTIGVQCDALCQGLIAVGL